MIRIIGSILILTSSYLWAAPLSAPKPAASSGAGSISASTAIPVGKAGEAKSGDSSLAVANSKEFSPTIYTSDDCLVKNYFEACQKWISERPQEKSKEIFQIAKKACELKGEGCVGLHSTAVAVGSDATSGLQKFLEAQCVKSPEACNELSAVYEMQKDYPNAIDYSRKYYLKFQKGNFAKFSYLYGDKNEAYAASLNSCSVNNSECSNYIKTMPEHPQMTKLISFADKHCKKSTTSDACVLVGTFYNKKSEFAKSAEVWNYDCKNNSTYACLYIIGSKGMSADQKYTAYNQLCSGIADKVPASILNLQKMNCRVPLPAEIPAQLRTFAEYELRKAELAFK